MTATTAIESSAQARLARHILGDAMTEDQIQRAVISHIALRARRGVVACHVPNGGKRSKAEAGRFKAAGVVSGVPDVLIFANGRSFGLELKSSSGRLSHAQVDMHRRLSEAGMKVATAYGLSAALEQLDTWGLMR